MTEIKQNKKTSDFWGVFFFILSLYLCCRNEGLPLEFVRNSLTIIFKSHEKVEEKS